MTRFSFLKDKTVTQLENITQREAILEGFLMEKSINILYGKAGLGKTWLLFSLSKLLASKGLEVVYLDSDNSIDTVKDRRYDKVLQEYSRVLNYINGDMLDDVSEFDEIFKSIEANAVLGYENAVFILDSLQFFLGNDMYSESKINAITRFCKVIRRAGGTVLIINHTTKDGKAMKGGGSLINALDEVWEVEKTHEEDGIMQFLLHPTKYRMQVSKSAFVVDTGTLELQAIDATIATVHGSNEEFVKSVCDVLSSAKLSQNKLLEALEYNKSDKSKIALLEKYVGSFWNIATGANRAKIYSIKETPTTPTTPGV